MADLSPELATREQTARLMGVARTTLDDWVAKGCPCYRPAPRRGVAAIYRVPDVIAWRINQAIASADPDDLDANREKARLYKEQADQVAFKNQIARGETLPAPEVVAGWQAAVGRARSLLLGIPTAAAARLVVLARKGGSAASSERAIRDFLREQIDVALGELVNTAVDEDDEDEAQLGDIARPN